MSLKKVEQVKRDRGFKLPDLIIYGAIAVMLAVLFIVLFAVRKNEDLRGVKIKLYGTAVFACNFDNGTYDALTDDFVEFDEPQNGVQLVTVYSGQNYNVVEINYSARTVKVVEADCRNHDCMYSNIHPTQIIKSNKSLPIYCNPHGVVIEPLDYAPDYDNPDINI